MSERASTGDEIADISEGEVQAAAEAMLDKVMPFFEGQHPAVIMSVLGDLVGIWLAGHHPDMRDTSWRSLTEFIEASVCEHIEAMIEKGLVPEEWDGAGGLN